MPSPNKKASPVKVKNAVQFLYGNGNLTLNQATKILKNARPTHMGGNPFSTAATRNRAKKIVNVYGVKSMGGGFNFRKTNY
jgi:hypothetical protein